MNIRMTINETVSALAFIASDVTIRTVVGVASIVAGILSLAFALVAFFLMLAFGVVSFAVLACVEACRRKPIQPIHLDTEECPDTLTRVYYDDEDRTNVACVVDSACPVQAIQDAQRVGATHIRVRVSSARVVDRLIGECLSLSKPASGQTDIEHREWSTRELEFVDLALPTVA